MALGSWVCLYLLRPSLLCHARSQHAVVLLLEVSGRELLWDLLMGLVVVQVGCLLLSRDPVSTLLVVRFGQLLIRGWILRCSWPRQVVLHPCGLSLLVRHEV